MDTARSITAEDGEDLKREISVMISMIMRYMERLEEKMNIMISLADTLSNEEKKKEFIACTETAKADHFNLKKRFADFVSSYPFAEDSTVVFPQIDAFMKQELDQFDELRQLCAKFLSEEDQNFLDFLSDDDESFTGFPPLEAIKKDGFLEEHEAENISKIQEKLQSLMLHSVSNQGEDDETSLKEWLKQPRNGNEDRNGKIPPRLSAIDSAASLSLLLMEFMIIMPDPESIMKKLQSFKATLQDNDTLLTNKMLCVMEMVDKEAIDKKTKAGVTESQVDELIALFYELLLDLENITAFPGRPTMEGSESGAERWRARLKEVESLVGELKKQGSGDFEYEKMASLEMRIVAMWDQVKQEMGEEQPASVEYSYPMQLFLKM